VNITEVRVRKQSKIGKVRAIVSITIDGVFVIHDVKVIIGNEGKTIIAMPSRKLVNGEFIDIAHPINQDTRDYITETILAACEAMPE